MSLKSACLTLTGGLHTSLVWVTALLSPVFANHAEAAAVLTTTQEDVTVHSGPGTSYRPIAFLGSNVNVPVSSQLTLSSEGPFYKVLVNTTHTQKQVGYISRKAPVRLRRNEEKAEDFSKYKELPLANNLIQSSFTVMKSDNYLWTLGYQHYFTPGFFGKLYAGQWITKNSTATALGGEFGSDAPLWGAMSGYISFGGGVLAPPRNNLVFTGSKKQGFNMIVHSSVGLRYNAGAHAALLFGASQIAAFNPNHSYVSYGITFGLEVGL